MIQLTDQTVCAFQINLFTPRSSDKPRSPDSGATPSPGLSPSLAPPPSPPPLHGALCFLPTPVPARPRLADLVRPVSRRGWTVRFPLSRRPRVEPSRAETDRAGPSWGDATQGTPSGAFPHSPVSGPAQVRDSTAPPARGEVEPARGEASQPSARPNGTPPVRVEVEPRRSGPGDRESTGRGAASAAFRGETAWLKWFLRSGAGAFVHVGEIGWGGRVRVAAGVTGATLESRRSPWRSVHVWRVDGGVRPGSLSFGDP